ncbi:MAG: redoxin domain-containing protein [Methylococcales bacterium]|nr:redoxin domain-containing protein [Methylococcales bacterium]
MITNNRIATLVTELSLSKDYILLVDHISQQLDDEAIATGIALGEQAPDFSLKNHQGDEVNLNQLLQKGPVVLSFYRGDWCPICKIELKAQQEALEEITAMGGCLLAIAPQTSEQAFQLYQEMGLDFELLSDPEQKVIKNYQLQFEVPQDWRQVHQYLTQQDDINGSWNLPIPATFVLNQQGTVCGRYVSADFLTRMEPLEIIGTLERLLGKDEALSSYLHSKNEILRNTLTELRQTQDQLLRKEKKAIIGDLTAGLVHEIKNLLNPISFLDLMTDDLSSKHQQYAGYIYDSRTRILELIDEVRLLAKEEEVHYKTRPYSLVSIMNEAVKLSQLDADVKNKSIHLVLDYQGDVEINKNKIIQVLLNLIRNAAHALTNRVNKGEITLKTQLDHDSVTVSIIDNGIGMKKEVLDQIWRPFFTTKGDEGTGLGLDVCRNIIENHGGKIGCKSEENHGTEFYFSLPISKT